MAIRIPKPPLALIAGPTASGKSALALELAVRTNGVIINADSAQVYAELPVLSAAPTADEMSRAEHRLYGFLDGAIACSAADWAKRARREIANVYEQGRLPILAGGTGLYVRTLLDGIAPVPPIDEDVRSEVRAACVAENRARLVDLDPEAVERLNPADTARIARALEVVVSTGRSLTEWQQQREGGIVGDIDLRPLIVLPPRDWLYARCDQRFALMIERGALEEVSALLARKLDPNLPAMRGIGVREIASFVTGESSLEQTVAAGQQATRRYAKRQYTWFAHQPPADWPRFTDPLDATSLDRALELLTASA
jgi:tRNA dimethylallyltransferase